MTDQQVKSDQSSVETPIAQMDVVARLGSLTLGLGGWVRVELGHDEERHRWEATLDFGSTFVDGEGDWPEAALADALKAAGA